MHVKIRNYISRGQLIEGLWEINKIDGELFAY